MSKIKLSIIVPCYNVSNYVSKCLDSLANQTLKDIEIIVINDGSTDDTLSVIKKIAKNDKRFIVIDKKNGGVSAARNDGLKKAKGEYVGFLDSDDWLDLSCLETVYNKAKDGNYDVVSFDTMAVYPNNNVLIESNIRSGKPDMANLMIDSYAVIWNKIYKRDLLKGIKFNENLSFCEDVLFLFTIFSKINSIYAVNKPLHYYLQREGSLTYTYDKKLYQLVESLDCIIKYYKDNNIFDTYRDELEYSYVRYLYATFLKRLAKTKNKKELFSGYSFVKEKINKEFPEYKSNVYLKKMTGRNLYLKNINKLVVYSMYLLEKNKMN